MKKISVVIPLFNKEKAIRNTIQSVLNQTVQDFELIVVNDGSTDGSRQVVESISDPRITLINKENAGVSSARNVGIKAASSDYIALLDGDDFWDKSFLEEQLKLIADFPNAAMWGVNYAFIKGENCTPCQQGLGEGFRGYVTCYFETNHNDLFCSSSVVIIRTVIKDIGYFDERICSSEDVDLWYRIILKYPVVYYDVVLAFYNQNAENRVAYDTNKRFPLNKDFKYYISKFENELNNNDHFAKYLCSKVAPCLLSDNYYFGTKEDRKYSDEVVKYLRYDVIHLKYKFIFKTPRYIGFIIYLLVCLKKKLFR